eukprot:SAG31_NODE_46288_length_255_cov_0.660256_1_plen_63_part_01
MVPTLWHCKHTAAQSSALLLGLLPKADAKLDTRQAQPPQIAIERQQEKKSVSQSGKLLVLARN